MSAINKSIQTTTECLLCLRRINLAVLQVQQTKAASDSVYQSVVVHLASQLIRPCIALRGPPTTADTNLLQLDW